MSVDIWDPARCPPAATCAVCGRGRRTRHLYACTAQTQVGVLCLTLCGPCIDYEKPLPRLGLLEAFAAVAAHCAHLGIDVDQMAAVLEAAQDRESGWYR